MIDQFSGNLLIRAFLIPFCLACPALAEQEAARPADCAQVLTVQSELCTLQRYFRCPSDGPGVHRAETDAGLGITLRSTMTDTYGLIEVVFHGGGISLRGKSDSMARIDWQALLPGEPYRYSYAGEADAAGHTYVFSAQGTATLVASDILIDGHSFAKIRLEDELYLEGSATPMGVAVYLYWSPEIGLPIEGETGVRQRDGSWLMDVDSPPVEVRSPGEPGFDATEPTLNCNILGSVVRPEASASA